MTADRIKMSKQHEQFLAELIGGQRNKGSGSQWTAQGDGRASRMKHAYGFMTEGKSTCGIEIKLTREIVAKAIEQAGGERVLFGLRWYEDESLRKVTWDIVGLFADDFGEILAAAELGLFADDLQAQLNDVTGQLNRERARTGGLVTQLAKVRQERDELMSLMTQLKKTEEPSAPLLNPGQLPPALPAPGQQPPALPSPDQQEMMRLGMPPREYWPCLVIDKAKEGAQGTKQIRAWNISASGIVSPVPGAGGMSLRLETDGKGKRLMFGERRIVRGELRIGGMLIHRCTDTPGLPGYHGWAAGDPGVPSGGVRETSA